MWIIRMHFITFGYISWKIIIAVLRVSKYSIRALRAECTVPPNRKTPPRFIKSENIIFDDPGVGSQAILLYLNKNATIVYILREFNT